MTKTSSLTKTIFSLALPTMLEQLMQTAVQYVDTVMVGSLGTEATAAVGSTTTVNWLTASTIAALGIGFLSYISKALGAGKKENASRASAQACLAVLVTGSVFTAATLSLSRLVPVWMKVDPKIVPLASKYFFILYTPMLFQTASIIFGTVLRAAGDSRSPMKAGITVNIINVLLNFFLIYPSRNVTVITKSIFVPGAGMGVTGAALASAASISAGGLILAFRLLRHPIVSPKGYTLRPDREILVPCLKVALPNMLQRFCTSLGYVFFASMINSLGSVSTAAHTVANTVESAFYIPGYGMQAASATLTGNCIGAGDRKRFSGISRRLRLYEFIMMTVSGVLLLIFAPRLVSLFSKDTEVIKLGSTVLRMVAVSEPFYGISIILEGMLQGAGLTKKPFVFNVICMWGVRILGTFILLQYFSCGLSAAWAAMIADNMLLLVMFAVYFRRCDLFGTDDSLLTEA